MSFSIVLSAADINLTCTILPCLIKAPMVALVGLAPLNEPGGGLSMLPLKVATTATEASSSRRPYYIQEL